MHKLTVISIIGLSAALTCLSTAVAGKGSHHHTNSSFRPDCEPVDGATATSRDLDWDGSDHVGLAVPADATYTRGNDNRVHASGDPQLLAHLQVSGGVLELDCNDRRHHSGRLTITLPGQEFKSFAIAGSGNVRLQKLDQKVVNISINGSGAFKADGKVDQIGVHISGSGNADLAGVTAQVATIRISGNANIDITPSEEADINIMGSGYVGLHTDPKRVESHITGSGRVYRK